MFLERNLREKACLRTLHRIAELHCSCVPCLYRFWTHGSPGLKKYEHVFRRHGKVLELSNALRGICRARKEWIAGDFLVNSFIWAGTIAFFHLYGRKARFRQKRLVIRRTCMLSNIKPFEGNFVVFILNICVWRCLQCAECFVTKVNFSQNTYALSVKFGLPANAPCDFSTEWFSLTSTATVSFNLQITHKTKARMAFTLKL